MMMLMQFQFVLLGWEQFLVCCLDNKKAIVSQSNLGGSMERIEN